MTTSPDGFTKMIAADLRSAWRNRENDRGHPFKLRKGTSCSTVDTRTRVRWLYNGRAIDVWRANGRLVWQAIDPVPKTKTHDRSKPRPLASWEHLDALVKVLLEGEPMVPRVDSIEPVRVAS